MLVANRTLGLAFIIIGVLANNYVYLHDIVLDKHAGAIISVGQVGLGSA